MIKKILLSLFKVILIAIITLLFVNFFLLWIVTGSAIRPSVQSNSHSVQESKELGVFYTDKLNIKMEGRFFEKYGDKFEIWLDNFGVNDTIDYGMFFENKKPTLGEKFLHLEINISDDLSEYLVQYPNIFGSFAQSMGKFPPKFP